MEGEKYVIRRVIGRLASSIKFKVISVCFFTVLWHYQRCNEVKTILTFLWLPMRYWLKQNILFFDKYFLYYQSNRNSVLMAHALICVRFDTYYDNN